MVNKGHFIYELVLYLFEIRRFYKMVEVFILPEIRLSHPFNSLHMSSLTCLKPTQKER